MSTKVVPASASQAKRPVRSDKPAKQAEHQHAVHQDEARPAQDDSEQNVSVAAAHKDDAAAAHKDDAQAVPSDNQAEAAPAKALDGEFTFGSALADAAASSGSMISDARSADEVGFGQFGDGDGSTVLVIAGLGLAALGLYFVLKDNNGHKNEAPTITVAGVTTTEDSTGVNLVPTVSDPNGDPVTVTATATNGTVTKNADGSFKFVPNANFNGTGVVTFTASDGELSTTTTANVTVTAVNDAPTVTIAPVAAIDEDSAAGAKITVTAADVDSTNLTTTATATNGTVTKNADGTFTFVPNANFNGVGTVTVAVSDGTATTTATTNITVNPVADNPVITVGTVNAINEDSATGAKIPVTVVDPDGTAVTTVATVPAAQGTVTQNADGSYQFIPAHDFNGTAVITLTATDGNGGTTTQAVNVTVNSVNDPAVLSPLTVTTAEDTALNLSDVLTVTDPDGSSAAVVAAVTTQPTHGTITTTAAGDVIYTPSLDYNGPDTVAFTLTDDGGATSTYTVAINVTPVDDGPVVTQASLDVGTGAVAAQRDAATANFNYNDDAEVTSNVNIVNFTSNDHITVTHATAADYNFARDFDDVNDLKVSYTDPDTGATNTYIIQDILPDTGPVNSYASAVAAVGFNFMTFA